MIKAVAKNQKPDGDCPTIELLDNKIKDILSVEVKILPNVISSRKMIDPHILYSLNFRNAIQ